MRVVLILIGLVLAIPAAWADGFTAAQRTEIVQVVRDALQRDPSILRDAIASLQNDENARSQAVAESAIRANRDKLISPADVTAGDPHGTANVVEFYDTRCPYCRAMLPVLAHLLRTDPHVRIVYKDMPVLGPQSVLESRALLAAARQSGYTRLQAALMQGSHPGQADIVQSAARTAGLDLNRLLVDMRDPAIQAHLDDNLRLAQALQIQGTPALVVGDRMLSGATDLTELREAVVAARR